MEAQQGLTGLGCQTSVAAPRWDRKQFKGKGWGAEVPEDLPVTCALSEAG